MSAGLARRRPVDGGFQTCPLPARLADGVYEQLLPQERILWYGRPDPEIMMRRLTSRGLFSLIAFLVAVHWPILPLDVLSFEHNRVFTIVWLQGAGLAAIGVALWATVPVWRQARRTAFVVTDRRFFALCLWPWRRVASYSPQDVGAVGLRSGPGGVGDVWLVRSRSSTARVPRRAALEAVAEAREVADLLGDLAAQSPRRPRPVCPWWRVLSSLAMFAAGAVILGHSLEGFDSLKMWYGVPVGVLLLALSVRAIANLVAIRRLRIDHGGVPRPAGGGR
jgi:hypothetical protein